MPADVAWSPPLGELPREPGLEHRIRLDPDDRDALAVYADFLAEAGDPRGSVLAAWLLATGPAGDRELLQRVEQWTWSHSRRLTRGLRGGGSTALTGFRGPLPDHVNRLTRSDLGRILSAPEAVALRSVDLMQMRGRVDEWLSALADRERPSPLRRLKLSWVNPLGVDLSARWHAFDGLDEVLLHGAIASFGDVVLPSVTRLRVEAGAVTPPELGTWETPRLQELRLEWGTVPPDVLATLLASPHLEVLGVEDGQLLSAILDAPGSRRLRRLELPCGPDVRDLVPVPHALAGLARLVVVEEPYLLDPADRRALEAAWGPRLEVRRSTRA
ncbi:MAG: hypothetical protein R3F61_15035 [Myxococcota bacterium]